MKDKYAVGVDLGGTKICAAVVNFTGQIEYKVTLPTEAAKGENFILNRMIEIIKQVIMKCKVSREELVSVGIGSPGPLDIEKGEIVCTPNLPFKNFNIVKPIEENFKIPVYLDNDANAAALGEYMFGAGKNSKSMVFITVSTGIGGGAILNGKIYRGSTNNALEIGHMTLEREGPLCNCGNYGCAEVLASGTAIAREGKKAVKIGEYTSLSKYKNITSKEVFKEAELGDEVSKNILDRALNYLGICVSNVVTCFDPEIVVIGGGVSEGGDIVLDRVKQVVQKRCFQHISENTKILSSVLGESSGVIGAAALAIMENHHEIK